MTATENSDGINRDELPPFLTREGVVGAFLNQPLYGYNLPEGSVIALEAVKTNEGQWPEDGSYIVKRGIQWYMMDLRSEEFDGKRRYRFIAGGQFTLIEKGEKCPFSIQWHIIAQAHAATRNNYKP